MSKANMMQLVLPKEDSLNRTGGFSKSDRPPESPVRSKRVNSKGSRGSRGSKKSRFTQSRNVIMNLGRENTDMSKETDSRVEDLELDLSKSEFLTEIDQNE